VDDALFANYNGFVRKVDAHTTRVASRHAAQMRCARGCTACCRQDLSVSRVEAERILLWLERHGVPERDDAHGPHDAHALFFALAGPRACSFLAPGGACGIYPVRPIICRTHGFPIQLSDSTRDTCPLNFATDGALEQVPAEDVIQLPLLNKTLALIERLHIQAVDEDSGRFLLSDLRRMAEDLLDAPDDNGGGHEGGDEL
ncbi:MAG: YkgJ family cysteine cluster protein, partial [Myxococcota bacterium]